MYQKSLFYWFISYILRFICLFSHDTFFVDIQTRTGTFLGLFDKTYNQDIQYINNLLRYPYINPKTLSCISVIGTDTYQYVSGSAGVGSVPVVVLKTKNPIIFRTSDFFPVGFFPVIFPLFRDLFFVCFFGIFLFLIFSKIFAVKSQIPLWRSFLTPWRIFSGLWRSFLEVS